MEKFNLEGHYNFDGVHNIRGGLTGNIEIAKDGSFEGEIYDNISRTPSQFILGHMVAEKGLAELLFLKIPDESNLANLAYYLNKSDNQTFEGEYSGQWGALPYKIEFNKDSRLFTTKFDLSVAGIGGSTDISLYKKYGTFPFNLYNTLV